MPRVSKAEQEKRDIALQVNAMANAVGDLAKALVSQNERLEALASKVETLASEPREAPPEKVVVEGVEFEAPPIDETKGVVFMARDRGFRQVIKKSTKLPRGDGDYEIIPPLIVEFTESRMKRLTDEEEIALLREKIETKRKKGLAPEVIELRDERTAEAVESGVQKDAIPNPEVNVHTELMEALVS